MSNTATITPERRAHLVSSAYYKTDLDLEDPDELRHVEDVVDYLIGAGEIVTERPAPITVDRIRRGDLIRFEFAEPMGRVRAVEYDADFDGDVYSLVPGSYYLLDRPKPTFPTEDGVRLRLRRRDSGSGVERQAVRLSGRWVVSDTSSALQFYDDDEVMNVLYEVIEVIE